MFKFINISAILFILCYTHTYAQYQPIELEGVYSEGNYFIKNNIVFTDAIVVNFNKNVINLDVGVRFATLDDVDKVYKKLLIYLKKLENNYGIKKIQKKVPQSVWGNTQKINRYTGQLVNVHEYSQIFILKFNFPIPQQKTIKKLMKINEVDFAHGPISVILNETPNDPHYGSQWFLQAINAEAVWDIVKGDNKINIGVVDVGTVQDHEDLRIAGGDGVTDLNQDYHGTHMAGLVSATTNNSIGISSLGWDFNLYTYGADLTVGGEDYVLGITEDILAASQICDVINMSWGTFRPVTMTDMNEMYANCPSKNNWVDRGAWIPENFTEIAYAIEDAINIGIICVSSSGNKSYNESLSLTDFELCDPMRIPYNDWPSKYPGVISASATDENNDFYEKYNYGAFIDVAAPGRNLLTTNSSGYDAVNGTSGSAALVSALSGLIRRINGNYSVQQVTDIITSTADKVGIYDYDSNGWNDHLGYGRINAADAVNVADGAPHRPKYLDIYNVSYSPYLEWEPSTDSDFLRYNIYRRSSESPLQLIASTTAPNYHDLDVYLGFPPIIQFTYYIKTENTSNRESIKSPEKSVTGSYELPKGGFFNDNVPTVYELFQSSPNPFNPSTTISYSLPEKGDVELKIFDVLGKEVAVLVNGTKDPGVYEVQFNASNLASGVYIYSLRANHFIASKKMLLIK